jgi:hypothetical protein
MRPPGCLLPLSPLAIRARVRVVETLMYVYLARRWSASRRHSVHEQAPPQLSDLCLSGIVLGDRPSPVQTEHVGGALGADAPQEAFESAPLSRTRVHELRPLQDLFQMCNVPGGPDTEPSQMGLIQRVSTPHAREQGHSRCMRDRV